VRLRNAAELLAHQPVTVTDVARLVGYRQPSHFVKAFRRRFGVTPGAFRDASVLGAIQREASLSERASLDLDGSAASLGSDRSSPSRGAAPSGS
jgi:AraC-like DNA-binding protein